MHPGDSLIALYNTHPVEMKIKSISWFICSVDWPGFCIFILYVILHIYICSQNTDTHWQKSCEKDRFFHHFLSKWEYFFQNNNSHFDNIWRNKTHFLQITIWFVSVHTHTHTLSPWDIHYNTHKHNTHTHTHCKKNAENFLKKICPFLQN